MSAYPTDLKLLRCWMQMAVEPPQGATQILLPHLGMSGAEEYMGTAGEPHKFHFFA